MFSRHHQGRRSTNMVFVIFRLILSVMMLVVLVGGVYSAYRHFSGLDPLKLDPGAVLSELLAGKIPKEALSILSSIKLTRGLSDQISQKELGQKNAREIPSEGSKQETGASLAFRFLLLADSHSDNENLGKAIAQGKQTYPDLKFIIGLGDFSQVGTVGELKGAKKEFDAGGLRYFLIPGDHDLWDCRNRELPPVSCFSQVFGPAYQSFTFADFRFILLDNSDNYAGIDSSQSEWLANELEKAKADSTGSLQGIFVFVHEPLYHPSSDHVMGWVEKKLKSQAEELLFELKDLPVKKIFAGDIHFFSQYSEPKTGINMTTVGAVTSDRNPQTPRFAVVSVFEDGSSKVEDVEIR